MHSLLSQKINKKIPSLDSKEEMERQCVFVATFMLILHLVQALDQTGFINVDCGLLPRDSPYSARLTGLVYTSDANLVSSGKTGRIAKEFETDNSTPNLTLRYFPDGERNCYNLNVTRDTNYMIKATFVYGNYDGLNDDPNFDLYLGPNLWTTVSRSETIEEIVHVTRSNSLQVCLVKTGETIPYINILELRPLRKNLYVTEIGSLKLLIRKYVSDSGRTIRYQDDIYDREWHASFLEMNWAQVTTTQNVSGNNYELPQAVMAMGATPLNDTETLNITWTVEPPTTKFYTYIHFAELQTLRANDTREFNVMLNGKFSFGPYSPIPLKTETKIQEKPEQCDDDGACLLQLVKTSKSTLPPLLNAIEAFAVIDFPQMETNEIDAAGIKNVQAAYGLNRTSWQGDPCVPKQFLWDGLKCNDSDMSIPPIITYLDLSASGLSGNITHAIQNLTHLEILALPNNNLSGEIPEFLADIKSLMVIDLRGNNLSGSVPLSLLQNKGLMLHVDGNPHLVCTTGSCVHKGEGKQKSIIVPVVASIAALALLIIGAFVLFLVLRKKKASKVEGSQTSYMQRSDDTSPQPAIMTKNRRFTYSEVVRMTNNFQRVLGKGGFGIVYHGFVNGNEQVAVKLLSHSSSQGYKQFKAEVELLLRVHHKNLVSLVGYCDEGEKALIYEYMANGDLKEHMSGKRNRFILNWGTRLKIVIDSAQGLEYLHNGCKPPMVHRDVKTTNILLNEHFEAKLSDFGLSRSFPTEGETHVSTVVAGTPGYLDPEYYRTNWLTEKSDVYSFGVVLLEMITNRPVIDQSREKPYIAEWVGLMLTKGDIISIMDPSLNGDYDSGSVWKAVELAMSCLNPSSTRRPTMSQVVIALNECLVSENSRGGASRDMDSKSSIELSLTFDTDVSPTAR